jgi:hypothetical protein
MLYLHQAFPQFDKELWKALTAIQGCSNLQGCQCPVSNAGLTHSLIISCSGAKGALTIVNIPTNDLTKPNIQTAQKVAQQMADWCAKGTPNATVPL